MKSYQILAVAGGVLGVVVAFAALIGLGVLEDAWHSSGSETLDQQVLNFRIGAPTALFVAATIMPFIVKDSKVGCNR